MLIDDGPHPMFMGSPTPPFQPPATASTSFADSSDRSPLASSCFFLLLLPLLLWRGLIPGSFSDLSSFCGLCKYDPLGVCADFPLGGRYREVFEGSWRLRLSPLAQLLRRVSFPTKPEPPDARTRTRCRPSPDEMRRATEPFSSPVRSSPPVRNAEGWKTPSLGPAVGKRNRRVL